MTLHGDAVDVLTRWQAPTEDQERLRSRYVAHLDQRPDGLWRSCLPAHLTTGALVLSHDRRHVLLNLHRKARRWFHFGGHLEPDDLTLAGAALREATEESGLAGLQVDAGPLHLSTARGGVLRFAARPTTSTSGSWPCWAQTPSRGRARSRWRCAGGRSTSCPPTSRTWSR